MKLYIISSIILLLLDAIYLNQISPYFNSMIKEVQGSKISMNMTGVVLSYLFLIFGLNYFIIKNKRDVVEATLLGMVIYGVYDSTNIALIDKWSLKLGAIDTIWGGVLFGLTTHLTYSV